MLLPLPCASGMRGWKLGGVAIGSLMEQRKNRSGSENVMGKLAGGFVVRRELVMGSSLTWGFRHDAGFLRVSEKSPSAVL